MSKQVDKENSISTKKPYNFMRKRWKNFLLCLVILVFAYSIVVGNWPHLKPLAILGGFYMGFGSWYLGCPECGWFSLRKKLPQGYGLLMVPEDNIHDHCKNCGFRFLK